MTFPASEIVWQWTYLQIFHGIFLGRAWSLYVYIYIHMPRDTSVIYQRNMHLINLRAGRSQGCLLPYTYIWIHIHIYIYIFTYLSCIYLFIYLSIHILDHIYNTHTYMYWIFMGYLSDICWISMRYVWRYLWDI